MVDNFSKVVDNFDEKLETNVWIVKSSPPSLKTSPESSYPETKFFKKNSYPPSIHHLSTTMVDSI